MHIAPTLIFFQTQNNQSYANELLSKGSKN